MANETKVIEIVIKAVGDVDLKRLAKVFTDLRREATTTRKTLQQITSSFESVAAGAKKLAGIVGAGLIAREFMNISASMDSLLKSTEKLGVAAEDLQKLRYAARSSGVDTATLDVAMKTLAKNMANLSDAASPATRMLKQLGIDTRTSTYDAVKKLADAFAKMPDGAAKTAEAMALLGREGEQLIPMLNAGGDAVEAMGDELVRLGGLIDTDTLRAATAFNDALARMGTAIEGAKTNLVAGMLPAFAAIAQEMEKSVRAGQEWKTFGEGLGEVAKILFRLFSALAHVFKAVGENLGAVLATVDRLVRADFKGALAVQQEAFADFTKNVGNAWKALTEEIKPPQVAAPREQPAQIEEVVVTASKSAGREADRLAKQREKALKDANDQLETLRKSANEQQALNAALRESEYLYQSIKEQQEDAAELQKIIAAYTAAGVKDMSAQVAEAERLIAARREAKRQIEEQHELEKAIRSDMDAYTDAIAKLSEEEMPRLNTAWEKFKENAGITREFLLEGAQSLAKGLVDFFSGAEKSFGKFLRAFVAGMAQMIAQQLLFNAIKKVGESYGWFASGAAFSKGRVVPFAGGGVVATPTFFPMANGTGVMGEAGPEAIMPLKRGSDGKLGVASSGGAPKVVIENHGTPISNVKVEQSAAETRIVLRAANLGAQMATDRVNRSVRSGYGTTAQSMQSSYGLRRR